MCMDARQILNDYIDACELIRETEEDIRCLEKFRTATVHVKVKGSMPEFPYLEQGINIGGVQYDTRNEGQLMMEKQLLDERRKAADAIRLQAEEIINQAPLRMQRIIRLRCVEGMTWKEVAKKMGKGCTEESIRKEFDRFIKSLSVLSGMSALSEVKGVV